ncbi:MAG: hypothetical protein JRN44_00280 [Nitrososphaerota archaeon]|jgi:hypothetical protein|nr:hypothetical protein [Nitrososphaerota archaeon]
MISIVTGLVFTTMVTHRLTTSQFGLLEVVTDVVAFAGYPVSVISYWIPRDTGRGGKFGKTAIVGNLYLSLGGCAVFALFALAGGSAIASSASLFFSALALVPVAYWYRTANAILSVHRPQATAYTLLSTEASKLAVGYLLIFVLGWGLPGVLLSLSLSNVVQAGLGTYFARGTFEGSFSFGQLKMWLKSAWLPLFDSVPAIVTLADTYAVFLVTGGYVLTGYFQAAFVIASMVGYSRYLSYALYPMLLRGGGERMIGSLFDLMMMVGVPMAVGVAALSPDFLYLLSKQYVVTSVPLVLLAFGALANAIFILLDYSLMGKDTSDIAEGNRHRNLLRGSLFFVPSVNLVYGVSYIASVVAIVYVGGGLGYSYPFIITLWALDQLVLLAAFASIKLRRLGLAPFAGTMKPLVYYSGSAVFMAVVIRLAVPYFLAAGMPTIDYGFRLILLVALGMCAYFGLLASVDKRSRERIARIPRIVYS